MPIKKVVARSGNVYRFPEGVEVNYTSGWAQYKDSNGNSIIDMPKENIEAEVFQEDKVELNQENTN